MLLRELQENFLQTFYNNQFSPKHFTEDRWKIYRNSIVGGLSKALGDIYPVCKKLVGNDFFLGMCFYFIRENPSYSPNLNDYGQNFAIFVAEFAPAASLPYLADICRLEWAYHYAHFSNLTDEKQLENLSSSLENIHLKLPAASTLICSDYPIKRIWDSHQAENIEPINLNMGGVKLLVWHKNYEVIMTELTEAEWELLQLIAKHSELAVICEAFLQNYDEQEFLNFFVKFKNVITMASKR